ncbi:MAG: septum formation protein Maf [Ruminococcaceae bacterium]|nr:septum formation protein Maf [Oscillospiraceae bacterium]
MKKVILASQSPRRQELLKDIVSDFVIEPSNAQEIVPDGTPALKVPQVLAMLKASDVAAHHKEDIVIGSDTVVVVDEMVLNKPKDEKEAYRMLKLLSGRRHIVCTGCAIVCGNKSHSFSVETEVEFFKLTDKEIYDYIATKDPMDKAGAYGVQSKGKTLVKGIYGDYYNVVGLPIGVLKRELCSFMKSL